MARSGFTISRTLAKDLRNHRGILAERVRVADAIVERARALAPVGEDSRGQDPGAYRDSIHTQIVNTPRGKKVRVLADDWKARLIEFGAGIHTPKWAVLRRAARQRLGTGKRHGLGGGKRTGSVRSSRRATGLEKARRAAGLTSGGHLRGKR